MWLHEYFKEKQQQKSSAFEKENVTVRINMK